MKNLVISVNEKGCLVLEGTVKNAVIANYYAMTAHVNDLWAEFKIGKFAADSVQVSLFGVDDSTGVVYQYDIIAENRKVAAYVVNKIRNEMKMDKVVSEDVNYSNVINCGVVTLFVSPAFFLKDSVTKMFTLSRYDFKVLPIFQTDVIPF